MSGRGLAVALGALIVSLAMATGWADEGPFQISVLVVPVDGGMVYRDGLYEAGETVRLTALPGPGYEFDRWEEGDVRLGEDPTLEFPADRDRVITAHFVPIPPTFGLAGRWSGTLDILPAIVLGRQRLELRFDQLQSVGAWGGRAALTFSGSNWTNLQLSASGRLGEIQASTGLLFDPSSPSYRSAFVALMWRGQGLTTGVRVNHRLTGASPQEPHLLYSWMLRSGAVSLTMRLEERGEGITFRDLAAQMLAIPVCCGIEARGFLALSKSGFDYLRLSVRELFWLDWGPGVSVDFDVRYTLSSKEVQVTPRLGDLCGPCVTGYGDFSFDTGFELYGYKILCCLGEPCPPGSRMRTPYFEFVTAFEPNRVPGGFRGDEFEYVKAGFCGPACCGGAYELELIAYFAPTGSLFGLTRVGTSFALPIAEGSRLELDVMFDLLGDVTNLKVGWDLRF